MTDHLEKLLRKPPSQGSFKPVARYYKAMDYLLYVEEDCSFRSDRVDPLLTLLWHPYDDKLVGLMLKGFRAFMHEIEPGIAKDDREFMPLVTLVAEAFTKTAPKMMEKYEEERREELRKKYVLALEMASNKKVAREEINRAVAVA